jgi:hypothetical protein
MNGRRMGPAAEALRLEVISAFEVRSLSTRECRVRPHGMRELGQAVCGMDLEFKQIPGVVDDRVGYSDGFSLSARAASSRTSNTDLM